MSTRLEKQLSTNRYRRLYENSAVAIFELDLDGNLVSANPAMVELFEYGSEDEFLEASQAGALFVDPQHGEQWLAGLREAGQSIGHRKSMRTRSGRRIELQDTTYLVRDDRGEPIGYQGTATDITQIVDLTRRLSHDLTHDRLTGLPNRTALESRVRRLMRSGESGAALFYVDLDQFRVVNDTLGHEAGDGLLRELGAAMAEHVGRRACLARLGGDEFAMLHKSQTFAEASASADELLECIRAFRFAYGGQEVSITASIGVTLFDSSATSVSELLGAADAACYTAKDKGRNRAHVQESNDKTVRRRLSEMRSVIELQHALKDDRFVLYQQPIVALSPSQDVGSSFELLLRLSDLEGKLLAPGDFLPAAEKYNLSPKLDFWVVETFFKWLRDRPAEYGALDHGAVNLSGLTFGSAEFLNTVLSLADDYGIEESHVCFEITETAAINDLAAAQRFIETLKSRGFKFSLDDFGSGVSSFGYLKHLPVDFIKIDGMFVRGLKDSGTDRTIVQAINEVAHSMGLVTIAEFVEDLETLETLREIGVDRAQGFALGRPEPLGSSEAVVVLDTPGHVAMPRRRGAGK